MIPLKLLKDAVHSKFDKDDDFDPSLTMFRYTANTISSTNNKDYPYGFYQFNTQDNRIVMGENKPIGADNVLTFHLFTNDIASKDLESIMSDIEDKFDDDPTLDVETNTDNTDDWHDPTVRPLSQNIIDEPETDNWHGIMRYGILITR